LFAAALIALAIGSVFVLTSGERWVALMRRLSFPAFLIGLVEGGAPLLSLLSPFIPFYFLCVIASRLGFMVYRNWHRLGWAPSPIPDSLTGEGGYNDVRRTNVVPDRPDADRRAFEIVEHTADVGLLVRGETLEALFANAARGMFHLIAGGATGGPSANSGRRRVEVEVEAPDREALLVAWLNELLFRFETERILFGDFDVREVTDGRVTAAVVGQPIDDMDAPLEMELKAATYHALRIDRTDTGWEAEVLFDV